MIDVIYIDLAFDQKDLIKPLLQHSTLLQVLDLSSNCLGKTRERKIFF